MLHLWECAKKIDQRREALGEPAGDKKLHRCLLRWHQGGSKRKMVAALRQIIEMGNLNAFVSVKIAGRTSRGEISGGPHV